MSEEKGNKNAERFTSRINRHLLFNTLNAAVSLCRRNPEEAAELLISLSDCLLYTSEEKSDLVFLDDELEFVRSYLYIQSVRFGKRLNIEYQIDNNITAMISPYAVYSVLDNVFEHVMMKTVQSVTIKITVKEQYGITELTIQDNGPGIAEEKVENFMEEYQGHSLERLHRFLEQNGMNGLEIKSKPGEGTCVSIHIARHSLQ